MFLKGVPRDSLLHGFKMSDCNFYRAKSSIVDTHAVLEHNLNIPYTRLARSGSGFYSSMTLKSSMCKKMDRVLNVLLSMGELYVCINTFIACGADHRDSFPIIGKDPTHYLAYVTRIPPHFKLFREKIPTPYGGIDKPVWFVNKNPFSANQEVMLNVRYQVCYNFDAYSGQILVNHAHELHDQDVCTTDENTHMWFLSHMMDHVNV